MADIRINALATTAASTASDDFVAVDGSANGTRKLNAYSPTFGGNLTVSGGTITGGTSGMSLASGGTNQNITLTPSGTGSVAFSRLVAASATAPSALAAGSGAIYFQANGSVAGTQDSWVFDTGYTDQTYRFKVAGTDRVVIAANTGNFLIGTTTDSGNGKLQLATHTTSAGGIGFGTDTALFRLAGGQLSVDSTGNNPSLKLSISGTAYGWMEYYSPDNAVYLNSGAGKSLVLRTNNGTTALTLDSSQNATFAGKVTVSKASAGLDTSITVNNTDSAANSTSSLILTSVAGSWTIQNNRSGGHLYFKDPATSATQLQINNSTGLATFAGAIAIGNTVNTVSPTSPNRTITMVIGGTTYYIHAKTTND